MGFTPPSDTGPERGRSRFSVGAASLLPTALAVLALSLVALTGCGGGGADSTSSASGSETSAASSSSAGGGASAVTIADYKYGPPSLSVAAGTTVKFTNQDSTPHTATSKQSGAFETGSIDTGKSATITLDKPGTYAYFCAFHPFMKGTITVE